MTAAHCRRIPASQSGKYMILDWLPMMNFSFPFLQTDATMLNALLEQVLNQGKTGREYILSFSLPLSENCTCIVTHLGL